MAPPKIIVIRKGLWVVWGGPSRGGHGSAIEQGRFGCGAGMCARGAGMRSRLQSEIKLNT